MPSHHSDTVFSAEARSAQRVAQNPLPVRASETALTSSHPAVTLTSTSPGCEAMEKNNTTVTNRQIVPSCGAFQSARREKESAPSWQGQPHRREVGAHDVNPPIGPRSIGKVQRFGQPGNGGFNRFFTHHQLLSDFRVGESLADQAQDLHLPGVKGVGGSADFAPLGAERKLRA